MDYDTITSLLNTSPALHAINKKWLPVAVSFFYEVFKRRHEVSILQDRFLERLELYLERVNARLPQAEQHPQSAKQLLDRWSREDNLLYVRQQDDDFSVQLTPHAERLIGWFEDMQPRAVIGTESRLRAIMSLLDEVITQSTEDVQTRLEQLHNRREEIEREIERIEQTGTVDGLSELQIRERVEQVSQMANQLLRDFGAVEERFREMAREIQQAQLNPQARRGDILATTLDANDRLEVSDEGQSLRAFYQLLATADEKNTLDTLIGALFKTPRTAILVDENALLRNLKSHLLASGGRVQRSNERLAEHLRRVVDARYIEESQQVQRLTAEIKHMTTQIASDTLARQMLSRREFFGIEGEPSVELPLERPLYVPTTTPQNTRRPVSAPNRIDAELLLGLYNTFYVDEALLQDHIERLLMTRTEVTLAEVTESYPITQGIAELIAYAGIAYRVPQHHIDFAQEEIITVQSGDTPARQIVLPHIIYRRQAQTEPNP